MLFTKIRLDNLLNDSSGSRDAFDDGLRVLLEFSSLLYAWIVFRVSSSSSAMDTRHNPVGSVACSLSTALRSRSPSLSKPYRKTIQELGMSKQTSSVHSLNGKPEFGSR
jgi:hypothetical protein